MEFSKSTGAKYIVVSNDGGEQVFFNALAKALKEFNLNLYVHPEFAGSSDLVLILTDKPLIKSQLKALGKEDISNFSEITQNNIMENKNIESLVKQIEEATGKKVTLQEAEKVATNSVGDAVVGEIIPPDSVTVIEDYVAATLKELKSKIAELETIKFDVSSESRASGEDWKQKTENVQFLIKQLERVSRFVNNTLIAKKFDKNILDKLVTLTPAEDSATAAPAPIMPAAPIEPAPAMPTTEPIMENNKK